MLYFWKKISFVKTNYFRTMRKLLLTCLLVSAACSLFPQRPGPDSLIHLLENKELSPGGKLSLYEELCSLFIDYDNEALMRYSREGLALAEQEKDRGMASLFYQNLGLGYGVRTLYDSSFLFYDKALALAIETADKEREAKVTMDKGGIFRRQREYATAIEYYLKALSLAEENGLKQIQTRVLINIGGVNNLLGNREQGTQYLKQAQMLAEQENDRYAQMNINYQLGSSLYARADFGQARDLAREALAISRELYDKKFEISSLYLLMSIENTGLRNFTAANRHASACLRLAREFGDERLLMGVLSGVSDLYFKEGRYEESAAASLEAWEMNPDDIYYATEVVYHIVNCYIMSGDTEEALGYLGRYRELVRTQGEKNFEQAISEMQVKYEAEKKETRIGLLEQEKKLYVWLGAAGLAILLLLLGLLIYRHRLAGQKRRATEQQIRQLEQEKQLIATQALLDGEASERSRLARDLHDGLGGLLSVIKLNLKDLLGHAGQQESQGHERLGMTIDLVDRSIGELRRVAHHMMPESLMRYGLKVSLEDFCHAVPGARFRYFGESRRLDSQLEVLIYRCAYELINNAVKHAGAPMIQVQLVVDNGLVSLTVQDNGTGFDPRKAFPGAGLANIQTRVSACNGKLTILSEPGKGTEITIEIELPAG